MEDGLRDRNEDGTTKSLCELNAGSTDGNPLLRQYSLYDENADLEARTNTETSENLVAEPLFKGRVDIEGGEHAAADGVENHARDDDKVVVTNSGDETSSDDGAKNGSEEKWENLDSSLDGANTLDGLEVESWGALSVEALKDIHG